MDLNLGSIAQWAAIAVTLILNAIVQTKASHHWFDKKLVEVYTKMEADRIESMNARERIRVDVINNTAKDDARYAQIKAEIAQLELKVVRDYLHKNDFKEAMDLYFNPLFLRIADIERKWDKFVDSKLNGTRQ